MTFTAVGTPDDSDPAKVLLDALYAAHGDLLFWQQMLSEKVRNAEEQVALVSKLCIEANLGERQIRLTAAEVRGWFEKIVQALKKLDLPPEVRTAIAAELSGSASTVHVGTIIARDAEGTARKLDLSARRTISRLNQRRRLELGDAFANFREQLTQAATNEPLLAGAFDSVIADVRKRIEDES